MAVFNPNVPQVNDPDLEADLSRLLKIIGPLGRLNVGDTVIPVVNLLDITTPIINVALPAYTPGEQFGGPSQVAPLAAAILADTLGLAAGVFDIMINLGCSGNANDSSFLIRHRNAANNASESEFEIPLTGGTGFSMTYADTFAVNQRLRCEIKVDTAAGERWACSIFAKRRA